MKSLVGDYGGTRCVPGFARGWKPRVQCGTWFERRFVVNANKVPHGKSRQIMSSI